MSAKCWRLLRAACPHQSDSLSQLCTQEDEEADLAAVISRLKHVLSVSEEAEVQLVSLLCCWMLSCYW